MLHRTGWRMIRAQILKKYCTLNRRKHKTFRNKHTQKFDKKNFREKKFLIKKIFDKKHFWQYNKKNFRMID